MLSQLVFRLEAMACRIESAALGECSPSQGTVSGDQDEHRNSQWLLSSNALATSSVAGSAPASGGSLAPLGVEDFTRKLVAQNASLQQELQAERVASRYCEAQASERVAERETLGQTVELLQIQHATLMEEAAEMSRREEALRPQVSRLRNERRGARGELSSELTKVLALREDLVQQRFLEQRLEATVENGVAKTSSTPKIEAPVAATSSGTAAANRRLALALRRELADSYELLAKKGQRRQEAAELRRQSEALHAEGAELKAAQRDHTSISIEATSESEAAQSTFSSSSPASGLLYARLQDGRQVELTGKVHQQMLEIESLRERLRSATSRNTNS